MTRLAVLAWLVLTPAIAAAQFPRADEHRQRVDTVRRQLASSDPKEVAWGAFTAASYQLKALGPLQELGPELIAALARANETKEAASAIPWLLDAIIQTRIHAPASMLAPHVDHYPVQTMLAFRDATGDADTFLLAQLASSSGERWYSAANLLLERRTPRFAAALLSTIRFRLVLHVIDDRGGELPAMGFISSDGGGVMIGDGMGMNYAGFPPTVEYRFAAQRPDALVATTGPVPVFYSRHVHDQYQFGVAWPTILGPTPDERLRYLQWSAGQPYASPPWRSVRDVTIPWRGDRDLLQQVKEAGEELQLQYELLLRTLLRSGALTEQEQTAHSTARFEIELDDQRNNRDAPVAVIPGQR